MSRESRYLSKLLRHDSEDLIMDKNGYVKVSAVLKKLNINLDTLIEIVETNDKQRFAFDTHKMRIRANQGHSMDVDIDDMEIVTDIDILYHGTDMNLQKLIDSTGLKKMNRKHVHMSIDRFTATKVGKRKNKNILLYFIDAKQMIEDGIKIYKSKNGVYLTDYVDPKYFINRQLIYNNI
jgi:putative RNA 2'-phosphotransferase